MSGRYGGGGGGGRGDRRRSGGGGGGRGGGRGRRGGGGGGGGGSGRRGGGGGGRGGGGSRGGGGYDWTRHLPPDHPRRRGYGPDPSRGGGRGGGRRDRGGERGRPIPPPPPPPGAPGGGYPSNDPALSAATGGWGLDSSGGGGASWASASSGRDAWGDDDDDDTYGGYGGGGGGGDDAVAAEYAAYYARRDERRRADTERSRIELDRIAAHSKRVREEEKAEAEAEAARRRSSGGDENDDAALSAAQRALRSMTEEEREAALVRREERSASTKHAFDRNPEELRISPRIGEALERALDDVDRRRGPTPPSSSTDGDAAAKRRRRTATTTPSVGSESAPYFASSAPSIASSSPEEFERIVADRMATPAYRSMLSQRRKLPAYRKSSSIASALLSPSVSAAVISGETGCGKTTQIPRILSESAALRGAGRLNVLVAQPRRIAAVGVAERYAEEGGTGRKPGEEGCDVGYHIRHDRRVSSSANVVFATTGIVLRILAGDPTLNGVDVVIVDEVHERSSDGDFLVTALRDLVYGTDRGSKSDRPLKLVLMSATVDADFFVEYLSADGADEGRGKRREVPVMHIEGVAHPVKDYYLEDTVRACEGTLPAGEDLFELPASGKKGRGGGRGGGGRGRNRNNRGGSDRGTSASGERGDDDDDEGRVRSLRRRNVASIQGSAEVADLVADFDLRAKISERESHLKSTSSGELPLNLAYRMVFRLDAVHRPKDKGDGAILVFLPGYDDIAKLSDAFGSSSSPAADGLHVLCLHGSMPTSEQRQVFRPPPPSKRKVVLATNVAESSITIEDVVYCLDLGKHKEKTYDPQSHIECLLPTWISKASARQRRGRAGRVREGECWHLYPSWYVRDGVGIGGDGGGDDDVNDEAAAGGSGGGVGDEDPVRAFEGDVKFRPFALPEMLRTPLEEVCLRSRHLGLAPAGPGGVERFLSRCPSPPGPLSLHNAMEALGPGDAMLVDPSDEDLTPMGRAVASIPAPPRFGLALMLADMLGCEDVVLTVCAILSGRPVFYAPMDRKSDADRAKRWFAEDVPSDLYGSVRAYEAWEDAEARGDGWSFCRTNFVSRQAMLTARANRRQLARDLEASKRDMRRSSARRADPSASERRRRPPDRRSSSDANDGREEEDRIWSSWGRVMGVLASSFGGAQLARLDHSGTGKVRCPIYTRSHGRVKLFPSCISSPEGAAKELASRGHTYYAHRWGLYMEKVRNKGGIVLYDLSEVSPLAVSVCVPGERRYGPDGGASDSGFVEVDPSTGRAVWSKDEVDAAMARRDRLRDVADGEGRSDAERVGARAEVEDIEARMGVLDLVGRTGASTAAGVGGRLENETSEDRVLDFVVSALETNGGSYGMAGLRRLMKSDRELYDAMGPVRSFTERHSELMSLEKVGGKWMFLLKPGARETMQGGGAGRGKGSAGGDDKKAFWGPKTWIYFDMGGEGERKFVARVRKTFREIVDASVGGRVLSREEERFLDVLGWALQEDFSKHD